MEVASWGEVFEAGRIGPNNAETILSLAHDPKLGPDRSVCLRDVLALLEEKGKGHGWMPDAFRMVAGVIERSFTEESG